MAVVVTMNGEYNASKIALKTYMRNKALYFPYIELPDDEWLCLMLLYWDQLSSIVPSEYVFNPQNISPHMSTLIKEGLVNLIRPQEFIHDKDDFGQPFLNFVRRRVRRISPNNITTTHKIPIHIEKLGRVADELVDLNLAIRSDYPWYEISSWVANAFMAYLASFIGSLPEVNSVPITNNEICFHLIGGYPRKTIRQRTIQRYEILKGIFPFPKGDLSLNEVIKFKEKRGNELARFRGHIEGMCIELANLPDPDDREEKKQITIRALTEEIDDIAGRMRETWHQVVFLDILPVLSAGGPLSLPTVIYQSLERRRNRQLLRNHPLAYGALLKRQWLPSKREKQR